MTSTAFKIGAVAGAIVAAALIIEIMWILGIRPALAIPIVFLWVSIFAVLGGRLAEWLVRRAKRGGD